MTPPGFARPTRIRRAFSTDSPACSTFANNRSRQSLSTVARCRLCWQPETPAQDRRSMNPFPDSFRRVTNADGGVVLDLRRGAMFRVNPVGARVLDLLEQGDSPAQIAQKLSAEFSVTLSEVQADVIQFVESLETRGILGPR